MRVVKPTTAPRVLTRDVVLDTWARAAPAGPGLSLLVVPVRATDLPR